MLASLAGLAATGWLVWVTSLLPRLDRQPPAVVLGESIQCALLAWAWSAAITFCLYRALPKAPGGDVLPAVLRSAKSAVWFAPAAILLSEFSPATLAAALVLIVSATRTLYAEWRRIQPDPLPRPAPDRPAELFTPPPATPLLRQLAPALTVSSTLQAAVLAWWTGYPLPAAAFLALGVAMLTLFALVAGAGEAPRVTTLPRALLGAALTVILAAGLTVAGLRAGADDPAADRWDFTSRPRPGAWQSARSLLRALFSSEAPEPSEVVTALYTPPSGPAEINHQSYPGVILWPVPPPKPAPVLRLSLLHGGTVSAAPPELLSIPFAGEYWMFKPPYLRPPQHSYIRRTSPVALGFLTTDHRPLFMEAYHKLDPPLPLACCTAIRMVIANSDRFSGTIALELILVNSRLPGQPSQSLGKAPVRSQPEFWSQPPTPAFETLEYALPAASPLGECDVFKIVFHRARMRIDRSARIAIDRFVLLTRSL
ncbi:MAG TPA: hypothetical protein VFA33_16860 [Bryobacteraceae bacterium]|nr:hypothetical protein [Bryobacteraceae bacterium]